MGGLKQRDIVREDEEDVVESPEMSPPESPLRSRDRGGRKKSPVKQTNVDRRGTVFNNGNPE